MFFQGGTASAPVLVADSYYTCTNGTTKPSSDVIYIVRTLSNGSVQSVKSGTGQVEYVCGGITTTYTYSADNVPGTNPITLACN